MDYDPPDSPGSKPIERDFERVLSLGVHAAIKTIEDYSDAYLQGVKDFQTVFKDVDRVITPELWREAHALVYSGVHPWAGNFREEGEPAMLVGGKFLAPDPYEIEPKLGWLWDSQIAHEVKSRTEEAKLVFVAEVHCTFENIHPFQDGNGRLGRLIIDHQMDHSFGRSPWKNLDFLDYRHALETGNRQDFSVMAGLLRTSLVQSQNLELFPQLEQEGSVVQELDSDLEQEL